MTETRGRKPSLVPSEAKFLKAIKDSENGTPRPNWLKKTPEVDNGVAILKHQVYETVPFWAVDETNPELVNLITLRAEGRRITKETVNVAIHATLSARDYAPVTTEE